jgi:hypothetical protein
MMRQTAKVARRDALLGAAEQWAIVALAAVVSLMTLIYPLVRSFCRLEINYNEGWNVYNTQAAMGHVGLYATAHSWTVVNYPPLSFYIVGSLAREDSDYLLTGRLLSIAALLVSCAIVGLIVRALAQQSVAAAFASVFCLGLICTREPGYVGMDDPQMLAHPFFLFGLLLYVRRVPDKPRTALITLLFVIGGSIKHNLLPLPLAMLVDLGLTSRRQTVGFIVFGTMWTLAALAAATFAGGPFFLSALLLPRQYSLSKAIVEMSTAYLPLGILLAVSVVWSITRFSDRCTRIVSLYLALSVMVGIVFSGGDGVYTNAYRDSLFAMAIIVGLSLDALWADSVLPFGGRRWWGWVAPAIAYLSVAFMFGASGRLNLPKHIRLLGDAERQFASEITFLRDHAGNAICESLLRCYYAGKPYTYDPFNGKRLMQFGRMDAREIIERIANQQYAVIQTSELTWASIENGSKMPDTLFFTGDVVAAIQQHYVLAREDIVVDSNPPEKCLFYLPRAPQQ